MSASPAQSAGSGSRGRSDVYTETERINALSVGIEIHKTCVEDETTALAAFGVAVSLVSSILRISLKEAASLVADELTRTRS